MRSGKIIAKNDYLIEEIINNPDFKIFENGTIYRKIKVKGFEFWKVQGTKDRENYLRLWWKSKRLFAHRVVYRKFNGALQADLVVNHKDTNTRNNSASNLELITHKQNIEYKKRRLDRTGK